MTFDNLGFNIDEITDDIAENVIDPFTRKLTSAEVREDDFKSYWEMDKRPNNPDKVRVYKGLSINKIYEDNEEIIRETYKSTKSFKPITQYFSHYCIMKFNEGAGKVWDKGCIKKSYHCTFYKSDQFSIDLLNVIEIKEI